MKTVSFLIYDNIGQNVCQCYVKNLKIKISRNVHKLDTFKRLLKSLIIANGTTCFQL